MSDFSDSFKDKLRKKAEGLDYSSPSNFLQQISEELKSEQEKDKVFQFKKSLSKSLQETKQKALDHINIFDNQLSIITEEVVSEIQEQEIEIIEPEIIKEDYITSIVNSITKEELNKSVKEHTDTFNQPNSKKSDPSIKALRDKVQFIENWVYKISAAGPGGGEVNFRWLDDVNRDTIGNTDQILRYNPEDKKFFFGQLSGDQGPIRSLEFVSTGAGVIQTPRMLEWNSAKDCLNVYQDDNTTLQVGLENYIRVANPTANTLYNGTVVGFSGVNGDRETPECLPVLANSSFTPLYIIGVVTADILPGEIGRATVLGEVRGLNTTGIPVGETWNIGDLLWASPTQAGKLTNVRPTAPEAVISIAAVLKKDANSGIILVRPTIPPRLFFGSYYDINTQHANTINTPYPVRMSNTAFVSGFTLANNNTEIVAQNAGLYNYQFSIQINTSNSAAADYWIWYRKNRVDVPHSATKMSIASNKETKVAAWNFIESMEIGDSFQLMWATNDTEVSVSASPSTAFCPQIPSVITTVTQVTL